MWEQGLGKGTRGGKWRRACPDEELVAVGVVVTSDGRRT